MQKRYSDEFKEAIMRKMMPPHPVSIPQLSRDTGVSDVTLYKWRKQYRNKGVAVPANNKKSDKWSAEDKLAVVIETASFNEIQLSEYCRQKGLYKEQVEQWKASALSGYKNSAQLNKVQTRNRREDKQKINKLERELKRKEKALAETAALLVLSKKWNAIWEESEGD
ncbi:MAG: transposase [bacterium]|nr:transposase [bacterium]